MLQVIYKSEVMIREFPEHFMYSLGTYDPDQSNETVQVRACCAVMLAWPLRPACGLLARHITSSSCVGA